MDISKDLIGRRFGKTEVQEILGIGGYSYSFLGFDPDIQKHRVVKVSKQPLEGGVGTDDSAFVDFVREGMFLSRLKHPQIVSLMEQGTAHGCRYMILDYIKGFDFAKIVATLGDKRRLEECEWSRVLDPVTALATVLSALEPLAYAHSVKIELPGMGVVEGLAHRDISSNNLMLGTGHEHEGKVHLIDFGIARTQAAGSQTFNLDVVGNVRYMSPMRILKKKPGAENQAYWKTFRQTQHDVHAMGCFLWELLTGNTPVRFHKGDVAATISAVTDPATYQEVFREAKKFDKRIQGILHRSLIFPNPEKSGSGQYADATAMRREVREAYSALSGNAPENLVLTELAYQVNDPSKLQIGWAGVTTRVLPYSQAGKVLSGFNENPLRSAFQAVALVAVLVVAAWMGIAISKRATSGGDSAAGHTADAQGIRGESLDVGVEGSAGSGSVPGADRPAVAPSQQGGSGRFRGREESSPSPRSLSSPAEVELTKGWRRLQEYLRTGQEIAAYKEVSRLLEMSQDPAFYLIKADLIHRRNPGSPSIAHLLEGSQGRKSGWMTPGELENHRHRLSAP